MPHEAEIDFAGVAYEVYDYHAKYHDVLDPVLPIHNTWAYDVLDKYDWFFRITGSKDGENWLDVWYEKRQGYLNKFGRVLPEVEIVILEHTLKEYFGKGSSGR